MARVSVVGLGKLGACMLAVLSTKHKVIGVDQNQEVVDAINLGEPPVHEAGLGALLRENRGRYSATTVVDEVSATDVTFIIVPTPSQPDGAFLNNHVISAVSAVGKAIKHKTAPHLVVITSTVMPGATMGPIAAALVANAAKPLGPQLAVAYNPEFIALGSVIHDMQHPDMLLIGSSDVEAGDLLERLLTSVMLADVPVARLSVPEAEVAKLSVNCLVTTKLSAANTLAELCEHVPGADAANVAAAIGMDSRIGSKYLQPATSWAGPCFPRDNEAFVAFASSHGQRAPIAEATIVVNDRQADRLANLVELVTAPGDNVGILGMAYKPATPVLDRSIGITVSGELARRGLRVTVHDPLAQNLDRQFDNVVVRHADTAVALVKDSATVVIAQPCPEYRCLHQHLAGKTVIDVWNLFKDPRFLRPGVYQWGMP